MNDREVLYKNRLSFSHHVCEDTFCSFGQVFNAGGAFKWYRDLFYDENMSYPDITKSMPQDPTDIYFLPFLTGMGTPEMLSDIRGAFFNLSLSTDKHIISKAILEGVTFEMRYNLELIENIIESSVYNVVSVGGASKSDLWMQLKADITGKTIYGYDGLEPGSAGAAILAGVGAGIFCDAQQGCEHFKKHYNEKCFKPDMRNTKSYEDKYKEYCNFRIKLL